MSVSHWGYRFGQTRHYCNGEVSGLTGAMIRRGCGRTFIHEGSCPFCGLKLSSNENEAATRRARP